MPESEASIGILPYKDKNLNTALGCVFFVFFLIVTSSLFFFSLIFLDQLLLVLLCFFLLPFFFFLPRYGLPPTQKWKAKVEHPEL